MRFLALTALAAFITFTACDGDETKPALDAITTSDAIALDTTATEDVAQADTTEPEDIAVVADTTDATIEDVAADTTTVEDIATPDTTTTDVAIEDTTPEDTTTSAGACDNDADRAELQASENTLPDTIQTCVFECLSTIAGSPDCGSACMERDTELSGECSACFGEVMQCTFNKCALQCIGGASQGCDDCRNTNCTPAFEECSGVSQP